MAILLRHQPLVQASEIVFQGLPVLLLRDPIHADRRIVAHALVGSHQGGHIDKMCQRVEPSFGLPFRSLHYLQSFR